MKKIGWIYCQSPDHVNNWLATHLDTHEVISITSSNGYNDHGYMIWYTENLETPDEIKRKSVKKKIRKI